MQEKIQGRQAIEKDEISLRELIDKLRVLKNYLVLRKKTIVVFTLLGGFLGLIYSLITPIRYSAITSFVVESTKKGGLGDYSSIAARFGLSAPSSGGGLFQEDNNIITFMKSRTMIAQTLYSEGNLNQKNQLLIERFCESNGFRKEWSENKQLSRIKFHVNPSERTISEDSLITAFYKIIIKNILNVEKPDKEEDIIQVTTTSTDELFSKAFNEKLLENVANFFVSTQTKRSLENVTILEHQVDSIRGLLNAALSSVAVSTDANPNPNPAFQRIKVPIQKRMIDVELNKSMLEELVKNLEISKISLRKETPLVQVIDTPVLPLEKIKLGKLKGIFWGTFLGSFLAIGFFSLKLFIRSLLK